MSKREGRQTIAVVIERDQSTVEVDMIPMKSIEEACLQ